MAGTNNEFDLVFKSLKGGIDESSRPIISDTLSRLNDLIPQITLAQITQLQTYFNKNKKITDIMSETDNIGLYNEFVAKLKTAKNRPQSLESAGENLGSLAPLAEASLQGYGLQLQGRPGELGLEEIRATTGNLQNLQQQFNDAMSIIVTTQEKFQADSVGKAESELARLSAEADAEVKKQTERIMALYIKMGEAAAIMAAKRQVRTEEIEQLQQTAEDGLTKIRRIQPSIGARLEVGYNKYVRPSLTAAYEALPDKTDVALTSIASTALLGSGIITAQTIVPATAAAAGQTAMAAASSLLLPPVPLATGLSGTVLFALCDVLGSGIFGGLSLACLIALLSNEGTRNKMLDILRRSKNKASSMSSSAASYLADSWAAQQLAKLARASEDAVNNLRTSAEATLHSVLIEQGLATLGNEDSYENKKEIQDDIKDIQQILNDAPGMTDELKALAKENGCDEETGNCSIEALTAAAVALSNASSRVPSRSVSAAVSQSTTPMRQGQGDYKVLPRAPGSSGIRKPEGSGMALLKERLSTIAEQQGMDTGSSSSSSSSASGGITKSQYKDAVITNLTIQQPEEGKFKELLRTAWDQGLNPLEAAAQISNGTIQGAMDIGGRRKTKQRKTRQRKTKQRKTKRQVKRRSQTKKGKKRTQTKKVVRRMSLQMNQQKQMKQQKQKMSSQQMQKLMMQQQMMKYNQQNVQQY